MALTARGLAAHPGLELRLVAGAAGADRPIGWAHAIELPDPTPWLSGGELVMTTGLNLPADDPGRRAYVARIAAAGAAGLAFDTGTAHSGVPAAVRAAGDAAGLAVLAVGADLPFIAIAKAVADAVASDELLRARRLVQRQGALARAALRGGVPAVVDLLHRVLGRPVVALDAGGDVLAAAGTGPGTVEAVRAQLPAGTGPGSASGVIGDRQVLVHALSTGGRRHGYLAVTTARTPGPDQQVLIGHAASLATVHLATSHAAVAEALGRQCFALLVAPGPVEVDLLEAFGFAAGAPVAVLVVSGATRDELTGALGGRVAHLLMPDPAGHAVLLPAGEAGAQAHRLAATPGGRVAVGVGGPVVPDEVARGLGEARIARAATGPTGRPVVAFADLGGVLAVLAGLPGGSLRAVAAVLDPLVARDVPGRGQLLRSLEAYLVSNGHLEQAAAELGIHRHTLRLRLDRVGQMLDKPLDSAHVRADLWVALRARQLL